MPFGRGWVVEDSDPDGILLYVVLDTAVAHGCRLPRLREPTRRKLGDERVDPPDLLQPYVIITTGSPTEIEVLRFTDPLGIDLLARNARRLLAGSV